MNTDTTSREKGLDILIQGFIQTNFPKIMLEITPEEAIKLQDKYNEDIVINMDGKHPEYRTSTYQIERRFI